MVDAGGEGAGLPTRRKEAEKWHSGLHAELSPTYGAWVEHNVRRCLARLQERAAVEAEEDRRTIEKDPSKAAEVLAKGRELADEIRQLERCMGLHTACAAAAKRGYFVWEVDAATWKSKATHFTWFPVEENKKLKNLPGAAGRAAPPPPVANDRAVNDGAQPPEQEPPQLETPPLHKPGQFLEGWEVVGDIDDAAHFPPTVGTTSAMQARFVSYRATDGTRSAIVQEQLRSWMAVVRRQSGGRLQKHLPTELFLHIHKFLRPIASVILNPRYLAHLATTKRVRDLHEMLGPLLGQCFDVAKATTRKSQLNGIIGWTEDKQKLWKTGNVAFFVRLGKQSLTFEAPDMWGSKIEDIICSSDEWETQRKKEIANAMHFVRNTKRNRASRNDATMLGVRKYFEDKGFTFEHNMEFRFAFTVRW
ncbi:unnamed protein product [Amoebophrya sp. A120]|nr:unnamed protein product [Amoebophrya sp. A120]|eukprot:GSA120T00018458001.1